MGVFCYLGKRRYKIMPMQPNYQSMLEPECGLARINHVGKAHYFPDSEFCALCLSASLLHEPANLHCTNGPTSAIA